MVMKPRPRRSAREGPHETHEPTPLLPDLWSELSGCSSFDSAQGPTANAATRQAEVAVQRLSIASLASLRLPQVILCSSAGDFDRPEEPVALVVGAGREEQGGRRPGGTAVAERDCPQAVDGDLH